MIKPIYSIAFGLALPITGWIFALPGIAQINGPRPTEPASLAVGLLIDPKTTVVKPNPIIPAEWFWPTDEVESPIVEQQVRLELRLSERKLYVFRGDQLEKLFPVAVGKPGWETPTGNFEVTYMIENPGWTNPFTGEVLPPGPNNPLGERWIAFWTDGVNEIGFHGTPNRESIGNAASHGCVRLYNEHIRELYILVTPGTSVAVLP